MKRKYNTGKTARLELRLNPEMKALMQVQADQHNSNISEFIELCFLSFLGDYEGTVYPADTLEDIAETEGLNYQIKNGKLYGSDDKPRFLIHTDKQIHVYKNIK